MKRKLNVLILATFMFSSLIAFAQNNSDDIIAGKKIKIFSKILNEERPIYISLPYGYDQTQNRFPVIYVADGSEFKLLASGGMIKYFNQEIPQVIAVFIPNTDRGRDYSISTKPLETIPNSGGKGGENFLNFLTDELISFIDSSYRTTDYRIFVGYSATGGFVFNTLLSKPDYFDAYIAASPSLFFEDELLDKARTFFKNHKNLNKFLFVPYFERDYTSTTTIWPKVDKIIRANYPDGFRYIVKEYPGQAHVPFTALYDGLIELFKDWEPIKEPEIIPSNALLPNGKSVKVEIKDYESSTRYTVDGSEPTRESSLYSGPITVDKPLILKAKSFRNNLGESDEVTAEFKDGTELIPQKKITNLKSGLEYKYFERRWFSLPDTISIEPTSVGVENTFSISSRKKDEGFIFQFDGFIRISKEGQYRFYVLSTVKCKFFLANKKVIDESWYKATNDPLYNSEEYSFETFLLPGYYPIKMLYGNSVSQGFDFVVSYEGPGIEKQEIPAEVLFHKQIKK